MLVLDNMSPIQDAEKWDLIHSKIHKDHIKHSLYAEEREKLFPRASIVCDLGGGTGGDALYFLSKGHSVIVLDISQFALDKARIKAQSANLAKHLVTHQIDFGLHTLPLKDNSIDIAFSRISLNYFGNRHTTRIFKDIYRALKPGGKAFLTFKSPEDRREMTRIHKNSVVYEPGVYIEGGQLRSRYTVEQLQKIVMNAGITSFSVQPYNEPLGVINTVPHILYQNEVVFSKE